MGTIRPVGRQDEWCRRLHAKPVTEMSSGITAPTHFTFSVQPERCFAVETLTCIGAPLQRERRSACYTPGRFLCSGTYREPCTSAYLHHTMTRLAFANELTLFREGPLPPRSQGCILTNRRRLDRPPAHEDGIAYRHLGSNSFLIQYSDEHVSEQFVSHRVLSSWKKLSRQAVWYDCSGACGFLGASVREHCNIEQESNRTRGLSGVQCLIGESGDKTASSHRSRKSHPVIVQHITSNHASRDRFVSKARRLQGDLQEKLGEPIFFVLKLSHWKF
jgi:hypothetical protein